MGVFVLKSGLRILDPGKVIFGHFIYFGHFPIEIPIEAEKSTHMGRKGRRAKTKQF